MKIQKNSKVIASICQWIGYGALSLLAASCSMKDPSSHTIQIALPQSSAPANSSRMARPGDFSDLLPGIRPSSIKSSTVVQDPVPISLSDFTCYAVNIVASDIPANQNLACGTTDPLQMVSSVLVGFVPVSAGTITVSVPNGAARTVELVGVKTVGAVGCPDLNSLINSHSNFSGISQPYLLAQATTDIFSDTTVDMTAAFDPNKPQIMFQGCGGEGPSYAPTSGYTGTVGAGTAAGIPVPAVVGDLNPSTSAGASDLTGATQMTTTQLSTISISDNGTAPSLTAGFNTTSSSTGTRAVIQFQWDATNFDLVNFPNARVQLQMRGGQADACIFGQNFGVADAVYDQADGEWIALNQGTNYNGTPQWNWGGGVIPVPVSKLLVNKGGTNYVVVNVESNYPASTTPACPSAVYLAQASLQLLPSINGGNYNSELWLGSTALTGQNGNSYVAQYGQPAYFFVGGGSQPYTFSVVTGGAGGTIDQTGKYTAPATGTSDTVKVTDAAGTSLTSTVSLAASGIAIGVSVAPLALPPYTAGTTCTGFIVNTVGFGGTSPIGSATLTLGGGINGPFYSNGTCGTTITPTLTSGTSTTFYVNNLTVAGMQNMSVGGITPMGNAEASFSVNPGSYSFVSLLGPSEITGGFCGTYSLATTDSYYNATSYGSSVTVSSLPAGFYSDSGCTTSTTSATIPANGVSVPIYFKSATTGAVSFSATGIPSPSGFSPNTGINVIASGTPVQTQLVVDSSNTAPDSHSCILVDINATDSFGTLQTIAGSETITLNLPGMAYTSQSNCDNTISGQTSVTITSATGTTFWASNINSPTTWLQANSAVSPDSLMKSNKLAPY